MIAAPSIYVSLYIERNKNRVNLKYIYFIYRLKSVWKPLFSQRYLMVEVLSSIKENLEAELPKTITISYSAALIEVQPQHRLHVHLIFFMQLALIRWINHDSGFTLLCSTLVSHLFLVPGILILAPEATRGSIFSRFIPTPPPPPPPPRVCTIYSGH